MQPLPLLFCLLLACALSPLVQSQYWPFRMMTITNSTDNVTDYGLLTPPGERSPMLVATVTGSGRPQRFQAPDPYLNSTILWTRTNYPARETFAQIDGAETLLAVADLNGDNKPDLVTSNQNTSIYWYYRNDTDSTVYRITITQNASNPYLMVLADLNNDGWVDILLACAVTAADSTIAWIKNPANATVYQQWAATPVTLLHNANPSALIAADLNNDRLPEIIFAQKGVRGIYALNFVGTSSSPSWSSSSLQIIDRQYEIYWIDVRDLNNDGIVDVVSASTRDPCLMWHSNNAPGFTSYEVLNASYLPQTISVAPLQNSNSSSVYVLAVLVNETTILTAKRSYSASPLGSIWNASYVVQGNSGSFDNIKSFDIDGSGWYDFVGLDTNANTLSLFMYDLTAPNATSPSPSPSLSNSPAISPSGTPSTSPSPTVSPSKSPNATVAVVSPSPSPSSSPSADSSTSTAFGTNSVILNKYLNMIVVLSAFFLAISMFAAGKIMSPDSDNILVAKMPYVLGDYLADCLVTVQTLIYGLQGQGGYLIAGYVLLGSVIVPVVCNLISMLVIVFREVVRNERFASWARENYGLLVVACFFGSLDAPSLLLVQSRAFGYQGLNAPISEKLRSDTARAGIVTTIVEDLPQFAVGIYFAIMNAASSKSIEIANLVLIVTSSLSLLFAVLSRIVFLVMHSANKKRRYNEEDLAASNSAVTVLQPGSLGKKPVDSESTTEMVMKTVPLD